MFLFKNRQAYDMARDLGKFEILEGMNVYLPVSNPIGNLPPYQPLP